MPASYSIGPHFEDFVQRKVRSGRYASASEVVREGLRLMEERDAQLAALRAEIAGGRDSGQGVSAEEAFVRARARIDAVEGGEADIPSRDAVLRTLKAREGELRALGVRTLSLFGSVARGDAKAGSDVDLAVELDHGRGMDLLDFAELNLRLQSIVGAKVDLVSEPARKAAFQAGIDRDRVLAF